MIDVADSITIHDLKKIIFEKSQIPPRYLLLTCKGRPLEDAMTLAECGIVRDDTVHYRVRGCVEEEGAKHGNAKHGNAKHGNAKHGNAEPVPE